MRLRRSLHRTTSKHECGRVQAASGRHHQVKRRSYSREARLIIAYNSPSELKTMLSLGWILPTLIIDLYVEFLNLINGVWRGKDCLRDLGTNSFLCLHTKTHLDFLRLRNVTQWNVRESVDYDAGGRDSLRVRGCRGPLALERQRKFLAMSPKVRPFCGESQYS